MNLFRWRWRRVTRQPGAAVAAVACIALGVGALATAFTLIWSVVLKPLPYKDADRLMTLWAVKEPSRSWNP